MFAYWTAGVKPLKIGQNGHFGHRRAGFFRHFWGQSADKKMTAVELFDLVLDAGIHVLSGRNDDDKRNELAIWRR
jgi:hypothetical protein